MNRYLKFLYVAALVFVGCEARAAADVGNCRSKAVDITARSSTHYVDVTLKREWDDENGEWADGAESSEFYQGAYWYKATLTKGDAYVVYINDFKDSKEIPSNLFLDITTEGSTYFLEYCREDDMVYCYLRPKDWDAGESGTCTFYFYVYGDVPGVKTRFHLQTRSIADFAPKGTELNPIVIDANTPGSQYLPDMGGEQCYVSAQLDMGRKYVFSCIPDDAGGAQIEAAFDKEAVLHEESSVYDSETGTYILKLSPTNMSDRVNLTIDADDPTHTRFIWREPSVGDVGFRTMRSKVNADCGHVELYVARTANDYPLRVRWVTVADTAEPGLDYVPASGELYFEADGALSQLISVDIVPGGSAKTESVFAVKLMPVPQDELAEGEYSPAPSSPAAWVSIVPAGEREPPPVIPTAENEPADRLLSTGTFHGVAVEDSFADIVLVSASDGNLSATVNMKGVEYAFTGSSGELACDKTIAGRPFRSFMSVTLPEGTVADLKGGPAAPVNAEGTVFVEGSDGAEEVFFSARLYRTDSQKDSPTILRMRESAGHYTFSVVAVDATGAPALSGYLTASLAASGEAGLHWAFSDGARFECQTTAYETIDGVSVPFLWSSGGVAVGSDGDKAFMEKDGERYRLTISGGKYDYWTTLERLYAGWRLDGVVDNVASLRELELEVLRGGLISAGYSGWTVALDRDRGIMTGTSGADSFEAVVINHDMSSGAIGAAGFSTTQSDGTLPFALQLDWLDPEWRSIELVDITTTLSFDPKGGSGSAFSPISGKIGRLLTLPSAEPVRASYVFGGWRNPHSGEVYPTGAQVSVPVIDTIFEAVWYKPEISTALDSELVFFPVPEENVWKVQASETAVQGGSYVIAEKIGGGKVVSIDTTVDGPGTLSFHWGIVRQADYTFGDYGKDEFALLVDGQVKLAISNQSDFIQAEFKIEGNGRHQIEWRYTTENIAMMMQDEYGKAFIDAVDWDSDDGDKAVITLNPGADAMVSPASVKRVICEPVGELPSAVSATKTFSHWIDGSGSEVTPESIMPYEGLELTAVWICTVSFDANGASGAVPDPMQIGLDGEVELPGPGGLSKQGYDFAGWSDGKSVFYSGVKYGPVAANTVFFAQWSDARYRLALKTDLATAAEGFTVDDKNGTEGKSLKSTVKEGGMTAVVSISVNGPGTVSFRWALKMSEDMFGETANDRFDFYVDDFTQPLKSLTAATAWTEDEYVIATGGGHQLRWVFKSTTSGSIIIDNGCGSLDWVDWQPVGRMITVTFDPNGGVCSEESRQVVTNGVLKTLPTPTKEGFGFAGWYNGDAKVVDGDRVGEDDVTLTARWGLLPVEVSFDANGATGTCPPAEQVVPGETYTLPSASGLSRTDCVFTGWSDGSEVYPVGYEYVVSEAVVFTAQWKNNRYGAALDCDALEFSASSDADWKVESDGSAFGGTCLRAVNKKLSSTAEIVVIAPSDGLVSYWWLLALGDDMWETRDDRFEFLVDDEVCVSRTTNTKGLVAVPPIEVKKGQRLVWRFTLHSKEGMPLDDADARLDAVVWEPISSGYEVRIDLGEHVESVTYTVDGEIPATSATNVVVTVPDGAGVNVDAVADTENWYYITGGTNRITSVCTVTVTAGLRDPESSVSPAEAGLDDGPFADADSAVVSKVMSWAQTNGKTLSEVNAMTFTEAGDPTSDDAKAYLLDCAAADVATAEAAFKVTVFGVGTDGSLVIAPADGEAYGNGNVDVRYAEEISGPYGAVRPSGDRCFIKAFLIK